MIIFFFLQNANSYIAYQFESYKQCSSQNFKSSSSSSVFVAISILSMTWIPKKIIFIVSHNGPCYLSFSLNSRWLRRLIRAISLLNGVFQGWSFVVKSACLWRFPKIKCKILAINSMKDSGLPGRSISYRTKRHFADKTWNYNCILLAPSVRRKECVWLGWELTWSQFSWLLWKYNWGNTVI